MARVLVTGGTGLIGRRLCQKLKTAGFEVAILSRSPQPNSPFTTYHWNWETQEIDEVALQTSDFIIHLAGANIATKRWTPKRKQFIVDSRVKSSEFLHQKLQELQLHPKAFISASAVGYYGAITSDHIFIEPDPAATDFLGETCRLWEESASKVSNSEIRTVQIRTGVVLSETGGTLAKMSLPIKLGIGSPLGSGQQYMPWIHIDDLCDIYIHALRNPKMQGAYNAVAAEHQSNASFTHALAKSLNKKIWLPHVPAFMLKLILGEMADILLQGSRVSSEKIENTGFRFEYNTLEKSLKPFTGQ